VTGLFILGIYSVFAFSLGGTFLAPVSVVRGKLRFRGFWWRRQSYPIEGISGLAMVWSKRGTWGAGFWDSEGVFGLLMGISAGGGSGTQLERTHGGRTLTALYRAIEDAQGPGGALRTRALQSQDTQHDAIWDPSTGRTRLGTNARG
jgi:hypothetical protein